ncbi:hypothetical protein KIH39_19100 [Telmatocola sphagniphila]|uniref:Uncharacterized protein n=1 Tax=Telmatocola sphagniphila TaxID=1123043 RepID=A0A8E6B321_9BACT|nr:hypothetical protein [Telmatocola sphagniphila]QVL30942.1 hypothetical protein KIH39_19100 [Telmatocola sphagniphila]
MYRFPGLALLALAMTFTTTAQDKKETKWEPPTPPKGWKLVSSKEGTYRWFIPEDVKRSGSRDRTMTVSGIRERIQINDYSLKNGATLEVYSSALSGPALKGVKVNDVLDIFVKQEKEDGYKVSEPKETKVGELKAKEYRLTKDSAEKRMVLLFARPRVYEFSVQSTDKAFLESETADTFLKSLVLVPTEVLQAEAKARAAKDDEINKENMKKLGAKWTMDLKEMTPPEGDVVGMIHGKEFKYDIVEFKGSRLVLKKGKDVFPEFEVVVTTFLKADESLEGKTYSIARARSNPPQSPHISISSKDAASKLPKTDLFVANYALKLTFGTKNDKGEIPGTIYLSTSDAFKSFIAGSFKIPAK